MVKGGMLCGYFAPFFPSWTEILEKSSSEVE